MDNKSRRWAHSGVSKTLRLGSIPRRLASFILWPFSLTFYYCGDTCSRLMNYKMLEESEFLMFCYQRFMAWSVACDLSNRVWK